MHSKPCGTLSVLRSCRVEHHDCVLSLSRSPDWREHPVSVYETFFWIRFQPRTVRKCSRQFLDSNRENIGNILLLVLCRTTRNTMEGENNRTNKKLPGKLNSFRVGNGNFENSKLFEGLIILKKNTKLSCLFSLLVFSLIFSCLSSSVLSLLLHLVSSFISDLLLLLWSFFFISDLLFIFSGLFSSTLLFSFLFLFFSCLVLSCLVLSCLVLSCLVLSCLVLSCLSFSVSLCLSLFLSLCLSVSVSVWCVCGVCVVLCVVSCGVVCVLCVVRVGVCGVCVFVVCGGVWCVVWHAEKTSVCRIKTSPCVPAPRAHVSKHAGVVSVHTGTF